jgi:protein-S-isoprenylcysteine O-methyltransferase Ste14
MAFKRSWRIQIGFVAGIWFILAAEPTLFSILAGVCFMILGETIRFISAGTIRKSIEVTRAGIYGLTRNPLYIGSFLIGAGACIMGRDPIFSAVYVIGFLILYSRVIKREERFLLSRYGADYEQYLAEVPRIFPRSFAIGSILRATMVSQALKNREGNTVLGIFAILVVMFIKLKYPF